MNKRLNSSNTCVILCRTSSTTQTTLKHYLSWLDEHEHEKHQRYRFPEDKQRFLIARGLLKHNLSLLYPARKPAQWRVHKTDKGKPYIDEASHISITHSGDWVAVAIAPLAVGIDIEKNSSRHSINAIAEQYFTEQENQALANTHDKESLFFMLWTLKEAYLKAEGTGISGGLKSVGFNPTKQQMTIQTSDKLISTENGKAPWQCVSAKIDANHTLAVAVNNKKPILHFFIADNNQLIDYALHEPTLFNGTYQSD